MFFCRFKKYSTFLKHQLCTKFHKIMNTKKGKFVLKSFPCAENKIHMWLKVAQHPYPLSTPGWAVCIEIATNLFTFAIKHRSTEKVEKLSCSQVIGSFFIAREKTQTFFNSKLTKPNQQIIDYQPTFSMRKKRPFPQKPCNHMTSKPIINKKNFQTYSDICINAVLSNILRYLLNC